MNMEVREPSAKYLSRATVMQTEVGTIPSHWTVRPLLTVVRIANGQVDPKVEPYRSMTLVAPDHIEVGTGRLLSKVSAKEQNAISGKYLFDAGDIIYSKIRPYLRKAIVADFKGLCSADMYPLKPENEISSGFIHACLLGHRFTKYAESVSVRSGMPKINRAELAEFKLGLPPPEEQRAIAIALSDVDALIAGLERLIAKQRDIKQATMQQLLTGQNRLPGFSGEWELVSLQSVLAMKATYGIVTAGAFLSGGIPMLRGGDIKAGSILTDLPNVSEAKSAEYSRTVLEANDVVIALVGYPGEAAVVPPWLVGGNISRAVGLLRPNKRVVPDFLVGYLNSSLGRKVVLAPSAGSAQVVVNLREMNKLEIPLPSAEEQSAIATVLSDIDTDLSALEARLTKTQAIKQGMMQELLTGRTRLV